MKISVVNPIALKRKSSYAGKPCCKSLPVEWEFFFIDEGPTIMMNAYDQAFGSAGVVKKSMECAANGADAIIINCTADTALRAVREAVDIPVIGVCESTLLFSQQFTDQLAVLTFSDRINGRFFNTFKDLGMLHRLVTSRTISLPEGSEKTQEEVVDALYNTIKDIYDNTYCDTFMLGCSDFEGAGLMMGCKEVKDIDGMLSKKLEENQVNVVIYKPFEIAVNMAYAAVMSKAKQSRRTYPAPHTIW